MHDESSYWLLGEDVLIESSLCRRVVGRFLLEVDVCHLLELVNEEGLALSAPTYVGPPIGSLLISEEFPFGF